MELRFKILEEGAKPPKKGHVGDAGIDFFALETVRFLARSQRSVRTGVAVEIPDGYVGLFWDKSSISFQKGLKIMGGVIDSGYRGEVLLSLYNTSDEEQVVEAGTKVSQMLVQKFEDCDLVETKEMSETERGDGGFGSTGNI